MDFKKVVVFFSLFLLSGCMGVWITPIPEPESDEAQLYIARCGICHGLPHPRRHTYPQWIHIIGVMNEIMGKRGVAALSESEAEIILSYLKKNAR